MMLDDLADAGDAIAIGAAGAAGRRDRAGLQLLEVDELLAELLGVG
jgi:hypothetical protein